MQHDSDELHFNVQTGIIKRECVFRDAADIRPDEADAVVLQPPTPIALLAESAPPD